jgi:hypothetical protein
MHGHAPTEATSHRLYRRRSEILFDPVKLGSLELKNRNVMAPTARAMSPQGAPGENVAGYYRRRVEGGVGLIISEGTLIPHWSASHDDNAPRFYGDDALGGGTAHHRCSRGGWTHVPATCLPAPVLGGRVRDRT